MGEEESEEDDDDDDDDDYVGDDDDMGTEDSAEMTENETEALKSGSGTTSSTDTDTSASPDSEFLKNEDTGALLGSEALHESDINRWANHCYDGKNWKDPLASSDGGMDAEKVVVGANATVDGC